MKVTLSLCDKLNNSRGLLIILTAFISLVSMDMLWFRVMDYSTIVTKNPVNPYSAGFVWLLLALAIGAQRTPDRYLTSLVYGMGVGLLAYGVFNATNYAILRDWPIKIAIIDTLWGTAVCGPGRQRATPASSGRAVSCTAVLLYRGVP